MRAVMHRVVSCRIAVVVALAVAPAMAAGCGSTSVSPPPQDMDGGTFYSCDDETRAAPYDPDAGVGLERTSTAASFAARLTLTVPGPRFVKGTNTWTVEIRTSPDAGDTPVDGLVMKVTPFMPDHNHGTSIKAVATPQGGGVYTITPLYLYMGGYWEVTLDLTPAGAATDRVMFPICVPG